MSPTDSKVWRCRACESNDFREERDKRIFAGFLFASTDGTSVSRAVSTHSDLHVERWAADYVREKPKGRGLAERLGALWGVEPARVYGMLDVCEDRGLITRRRGWHEPETIEGWAADYAHEKAMGRGFTRRLAKRWDVSVEHARDRMRLCVRDGLITIQRETQEDRERWAADYTREVAISTQGYAQRLTVPWGLTRKQVYRRVERLRRLRLIGPAYARDEALVSIA